MSQKLVLRIRWVYLLLYFLMIAGIVCSFGLVPYSLFTGAMFVAIVLGLGIVFPFGCLSIVLILACPAVMVMLAVFLLCDLFKIKY